MTIQENDYYTHPHTIRSCKLLLKSWQGIPDQFDFIISLAIKCTQVSDEELENYFDISRATIKRWRNGKCSQHVDLREHTIKFFLNKVNTL